MTEAQQQRQGVRAITIVLASVGGLVLAGVGATAAFAGVAQLSEGEEAQVVDVTGVDSLDVDVSAADLTVRFADVDEAQLETSGTRGQGWTFEVDGDELMVASPDARWSWFGLGWWGGETTATLVLPESLASLDADLLLQAGSLRADGDFDELSVEVGAGSLTVDGSATALDVEVSAGNAEVTLDGVREASYSLSAGWIDSELLSAPTSTRLDVSAGSLTLTVPEEAYRLVRDVSAGTLDSELTESEDAANAIDVSLSAGSVELRSNG